jgi:integrase
MGGIWKEAGRTHYRIWWKDLTTGKKKTAPGYKDKQASEAKLRALERDEERRHAGLPVVDRKGQGQPLESLTARHIADMKRLGVGPDHLACQRGNLRRLALWENWTMLSQIQHASMSDALAHLDAKGYSTRTVEAYRVSWKSFLEWCVDGKLLGENPIARIKPSRRKVSVKPKRAPTVAEWRCWIEKAPSKRRNLYLVAGLTGLRKKELKLLERRDVDLESRQFKLRAEATKAKRADTVPMIPDVVPVLTALCEGREPHQRVFPAIPTSQPIRDDIARAGIVSPDPSGRLVTFHSLRYFFCTLLARTLPIQVVRLLMRHKDISVTCRVYLDLGLADVSEAVLKLPQLFDLHPLAHNERESVDGTRKGLKS